MAIRNGVFFYVESRYAHSVVINQALRYWIHFSKSQNRSSRYVAKLPFAASPIAAESIPAAIAALTPAVLIFLDMSFLFPEPPLMLLIGFGLTVFCNCFLFNRIFSRHMPSKDD